VTERGSLGEERKEMKRLVKFSLIGLLLASGITTRSHGQSTNTGGTIFVQNISFSLTACGADGKRMRITNKDIMTAFNNGTPVSNGRLLLVTSSDTDPNTTANMGANLRILSGNTVVGETIGNTSGDVDQFNLYQDAVSSSSNGRIRCSINRFSFVLPNTSAPTLAMELQGYTTWSAHNNNLGSFHSTVNGTGTLASMGGGLPIQGGVTGSSPKASQ
jgi:hypothetical protein